MKSITIKSIKCYEQQDFTGDDDIRLEIKADGASIDTLDNDNFDTGEIWTLNKTYSFSDKIVLKMYEEDWPDSDDHLGTHTINTDTPLRNSTVSFTKDGADYELIFDLDMISADPTGEVVDPLIGPLEIRRFFGRMGAGVMALSKHEKYIGSQRLYKLENEVISLRDTLKRHYAQDRGLGNTKSIRKWVQRHCNFRSNDTYITDKPEAPVAPGILFTGKNWETVSDERSYELSGFQEYSRVTYTDNPTSHETRDWNWDIIPDPTFCYLLGEGFKGKENGINRVPIMHNEWESGSFPVLWRPFWGEYITCWGRHIWDVGHAPLVTEVHPAHTILKEHTTAAPIGHFRKVVPVNRAIIGMGLSGGFPGHSNGRWDAEFGGIPNDVWGDTTNCWPTNLKKHPAKFRFFPPKEKPSPDAVLKHRVVICEHLTVSNNEALDEFLELTQFDDPASGGEGRAFRNWNDISGFDKVNTPNSFKPTFTEMNGPDGLPAYYDVTVDLSNMANIPVGYYAVIECGWSDAGASNIQKYEVNFKSVKALQTTEWYNDWHLYFGANGNWIAWWTDDFIEEDETYGIDQKFIFYTVDSMPIIIRDTGIEWNGADFGNEKLDTVDLVIPGPDHFNKLRNMPETYSISETNNSIEFKVKGKGGDTSHEWKLKITKK